MTESNKLRGARICILRAGPIDYDKRVQQIARLLAQVGVEVTILSPVPAERTMPFKLETVTLREVTPISASHCSVWVLRVMSNMVRNMVRPLLLARILVRMIRNEKPDLVHCVNVDTLLIGYRSVGARRFIYESQEHFASTGHYSRALRTWWMLKERWLVPKAAAVITVSEPIARDLMQRYRISMPTVIYSGPITVALSAGVSHTPLKLIHLGRLFADRNLLALIEAVARVGDDVTLTIRGWGEQEEALVDLVDQLGVGSQVRVVPPCTPSEITECIGDCDVGVFTAAPETKSLEWAAANKVFEYMGAGLAVLIPSGFPVMQGIIEDAQCGRVYGADTDSLERAIRQLVAAPQEVNEMKSNALRAAVGFTWDEQASKLYAVYEQALSQRA